MARTAATDPTGRTGRTGPGSVAVLALIGYLLAARGVGSLYPFSTFPMYSGAAGGAVSRLMARLPSGELVEVTDLVGWQCGKMTQCGPAGIGYVDREREEHMRKHSGSGGEAVQLVRRIFSFDGVERAPYCVVAECRARR
jgi:hypothetical protein